VRNVLVFAAVLAVTVPAAWFAGQPTGQPRVTVLPTTDGPTYLIEDGAGRRVLIGGGDTGAALQSLADRALPWDRRVDLLVLAPPFAAHLTGATEVVRRADTRRVIELGGPGTKPPMRYDAWQLATLDRGHVPERLWGYARIPLGNGASLDLITPDAPDGVPARLPAHAPRASGSTTARTKPAPASAIASEANAAPGAYVRLTNGRASVLLALGSPGDAVPGFARLHGTTFLIAPSAATLPDLTAIVQPHALLALTDAANADPAGLPAHTISVPRGTAVTLMLDGDGVRVQGIVNLPIWANETHS